MFEAVLIPVARTDYDQLRAGEQRQIDLIVRLLEIDPWGDDQVKFTGNIGESVAGVYDDGHWELVDRIIDGRFVEIVDIRCINS